MRLPIFGIGYVGKEDRPAQLAVLDLAGLAELRGHPGIAYQGLCW